MHKDSPMLLEKESFRPNGGATAGHARHRQSDPHAQAGKVNACGRPKTVLVNMVSEGDDMGAACVASLAEAGHRVIAIGAKESISPALSMAIASGRVATLPGAAMNATSLRGAIKSLPPLFRSLDAAVNILHLPIRRVALLDAEASHADWNPAVILDKLLNATRAAMPGLLASERGHVIAVTLTTPNQGNLAEEA